MRLPPVYPILDVEVCRGRGMREWALARIWLDEGVRLFQLRAKHLPSGELLTLIDALARDARRADALFIVNDRADLARMSGAGGVHVGQDDLSPVDARRVVGMDRVLGVSTHNDAQVAGALEAPVDYIAIGPVYSTSSKTQPDALVGLAGVGRGGPRGWGAGKPLVAIGGITRDTAPDVLAAGASSVAVIADLLSDDPRARIREYMSLLRN